MKIRRSVSNWLYFLLLPFVILIGCEISKSVTVNDDILTLIATAASFIVAIMAGFLIQSYYSVKQLRWEKLNRFAELQNKLKDYVNAFYWLVDDIERQHNLDYRFPESIETLHRDSKWIQSNDDSIAVLFVRYLRDFAGLPHHVPDFELKQSVVTEDRLNQMHDYILSAGGLLGKYKHFKHILKSFKIPDTNDLDSVIITRSDIVKVGANKITRSGEDFKTLGFWEAKITECEELLARMKANGKFVYSFDAFEIRQLGLNLLFVSAFGILLPIIIMLLGNSIEQYKSFLSIISALGFMGYFIMAMVRIYSKISSSRLSYS